MKAILEFKLPEEQNKFDEACNGWRVRAALSDYLEWLRRKLKEDLDVVQNECYVMAQRELREKLQDYENDLLE